MVRQARLPLLSFALVASAIYATAITMMRLRPELRHPEAVSIGLLVNLLVVVPLAYYLLVVRRAGWPARTLVPLAVLSLSGAKAAWILTALAAYGVLWFLADYRATRLRPILVEGDLLRLRTGLRWTLRIPLSHIAAIHTRPPHSEPALRANLPFTRPVWIDLTEPATAQGPYGKEKTIRWIAVAVDEMARFREALATAAPL